MHFNWNLNIPDVKGVPKMLKSEFGGMSKFLTYWCLVSVSEFSFGVDHKLRPSFYGGLEASSIFLIEDLMDVIDELLL
jgi:hypothetical protein